MDVEEVELETIHGATFGGMEDTQDIQDASGHRTFPQPKQDDNILSAFVASLVN